MWSRILIAPRTPNDAIKYTQYVTVALENSARDPLDIIIDLRLFIHTDEEDDKLPPTSQSAGRDEFCETFPNCGG